MRQKGGSVLQKETQLYRSNNLSKGVRELSGMMTMQSIYLISFTTVTILR